MTRFRFAYLAALLAMPAAPAPAPAQPSPPGPVWQMDWGDQYCTLIRLPDRAIPYVVAIRTVPGEAAPSLRLMAVSRGGPPDRVTAVELSPAQRSFAVSSRMELAGPAQRVLAIWGLTPDFWDAFPGAGELALRDGDRVTRVPLSDTARALAAMRRCVSNAMRQWGIDEAAWNALSRHPRILNALGISSRDYPAAALWMRQQGRVIVRIDVDAAGRPTACVPVATSRIPEMDAAACGAAMTRGRFEPALDAAGRPTAGQTVTAVAFIMAR